MQANYSVEVVLRGGNIEVVPLGADNLADAETLARGTLMDGCLKIGRWIFPANEVVSTNVLRTYSPPAKRMTDG